MQRRWELAQSGSTAAQYHLRGDETSSVGDVAETRGDGDDDDNQVVEATAVAQFRSRVVPWAWEGAHSLINREQKEAGVSLD